MFATILSFIGTIASTAATTGCGWLFMDEPEMPKSLIK